MFQISTSPCHFPFASQSSRNVQLTPPYILILSSDRELLPPFRPLLRLPWNPRARRRRRGEGGGVRYDPAAIAFPPELAFDPRRSRCVASDLQNGVGEPRNGGLLLRHPRRPLQQGAAASPGLRRRPPVRIASAKFKIRSNASFLMMRSCGNRCDLEIPFFFFFLLFILVLSILCFFDCLSVAYWATILSKKKRFFFIWIMDNILIIHWHRTKREFHYSKHPIFTRDT